jgi:hypothetical protein
MSFLARLSAILIAVLIGLVVNPLAPSAHAVPSVYPGSTTARLVFQPAGGGTLTYSANATGWASSGEVCIHWKLSWKDIGPDESYVEVDSGHKCGTGSVSTATHTLFCPQRGFWRMTSVASGPGGSDTDTKDVSVFYE